MQFTLELGNWYACEFIGDEFDDDSCSYSPIKVNEMSPLKSGRGTFQLAFYHANYPEGVRDKSYELEMLERGSRYLLAISKKHNPARVMQIYEIDWAWMNRHFPSCDTSSEDIQTWLSRNV